MSSSSFYTKEALKKAVIEQQLIISPLLDLNQIGDSSIDIRLGTRLITIKTSDIASIDPRKLTEENIKEIQQVVYLAIGDRFVLHPNQFILGATLEFISLPDNLCAFVLSRSKFGRAGLLVATATYVHPHWKGVLTLELSNASERPLFLECGTPVAQLVVASAEPQIAKPKYNKLPPTMPQFAETHSMIDWIKLDKFKEIWKGQGYILTK